MTVHKVSVIECDGCGVTALPETMVILDLIHIEGGPPAHAGEARTAANARGWAYTASGKDLCPECRPTPAAPSKIHTRSFFGWGHHR